MRTVPIHPTLIDAGLFDYVELLKLEGHSRLFPEITKSARLKDSFGKEPSRFFTAYRRACGVSAGVDRHKVFHSFRHTANSELRRKSVHAEVRERLVGHCPEGLNNKTYRPSDSDHLFEFATLYAHLRKLDYRLMHTPYKAIEAHKRARDKAAATPHGAKPLAGS